MLMMPCSSFSYSNTRGVTLTSCNWASTMSCAPAIVSANTKTPKGEKKPATKTGVYCSQGAHTSVVIKFLSVLTKPQW
jgi:hypothetical protein